MRSWLQRDKDIAAFYLKLKRSNLIIRSRLFFVFYSKVIVDFAERKLRKFLSPGKRWHEVSGIADNAPLTLLKSHSILFLDPLPGTEENSISEDTVNVEVPLASGTVRFAELKDRRLQFEDEQDLYALYRFRFLPFVVKGNVHYAHRLLPDIFTSMDVKKNDFVFFRNPYTVSERIVHLTWALSIISDRIDNIGDVPAFGAISKSVLQQGAYLRKNFEFYLGHHNHVINNCRALLTAAIFFWDHPVSKSWREYAVKIFLEEWSYQVLPDGVHAEQSSTYHFLLTRTLWEMKQLFRQAGEVFPFEEDLQKMIRYARCLVRPDGSIPLLGHVTPDWPWKELVGLLPVWGYKDMPLSSLGLCYQPDPDTAQQVPDAVCCFEAAGQGIIRADDVHAVLSCDPRCTLTTHGDQNMLGIDIWYKGTHVVRDAGLASYTTDETRRWSESWQGQSVFVIDGLDPVLSNWRKRQLPRRYYKANAYLKPLGANGLEAFHTCFHRLPDPVSVYRRVFYEKEYLSIRDEAEGKERHQYQAIFHFGGLEPHVLSGRSLKLIDKDRDQSFQFSWNMNVDYRIIKCPYATGYGEKEEGWSVLIDSQFTGRLSLEYRIAVL